MKLSRNVNYLHWRLYYSYEGVYFPENLDSVKSEEMFCFGGLAVAIDSRAVRLQGMLHEHSRKLLPLVKLRVYKLEIT